MRKRQKGSEEEAERQWGRGGKAVRKRRKGSEEEACLELRLKDDRDEERLMFHGNDFQTNGAWY